MKKNQSFLVCVTLVLLAIGILSSFSTTKSGSGKDIKSNLNLISLALDTDTDTDTTDTDTDSDNPATPNMVFVPGIDCTWYEPEYNSDGSLRGHWKYPAEMSLCMEGMYSCRKANQIPCHATGEPTWVPKN